MSLTMPTYTQVRDQVLAIWKAARPSADSSRYSDLWLYARLVADLVYRLHLTGDRILTALHPATTHGDALDRWLEVYGLPNGQGGYGRIQEAGSTGTAALEVTATGITVDLLGQQLTDGGGRTYEITSSYAFLVGPGTHDYDIAAVSTGAATNLATGATLTFVSPPANVQSTATLVKDLTGGTDRESDAAGRTRLLRRLRLPGLSGNGADWIYTIEDAAPGQLRAYGWAGRNGYPAGWGTTDYCALLTTGHRDDRHIGASDDMYTTISDAVAERMPEFAVDLSRELTIPTPLYQPVQIRLTMADNAPESAHSDWDAETLGAKVLAYNATLKRIQADSVVTSYLSVGDRVVIGGAQAVVDGVGLASGLPGDDYFTVSTWFDVEDDDSNPYPMAPSVGWRICSGGGLILDVVKAIHELGDSLGPEKGASAAQISGWDDTLRLSTITTAVIQAGGGAIVDVQIDAPAADVSPTPGTGATAIRVVIDDLAVWEVW